jgi:hypothetical protein
MATKAVTFASIADNALLVDSAYAEDGVHFHFGYGYTADLKGTAALERSDRHHPTRGNYEFH